MNLPQITIPVNIPFDIPTMLHQPLVHFAIAIPILVLLVEIVNLFLNNTTLKVTTSIFLLLLVGILFGAYLTGTTDGKHAIDNGFNAISDLKEHKLYGIYLFYTSIFVLLIKLLSLAINKVGFKIFYILILIAFNAGILYQGKLGGELVFEHAANVQMQKDEFDDDEDEATEESSKVQKIEKTKPAVTQTKHEEPKEEVSKTEAKSEEKTDVKANENEKVEKQEATEPKKEEKASVTTHVKETQANNTHETKEEHTNETTSTTTQQPVTETSHSSDTSTAEKNTSKE